MAKLYQMSVITNLCHAPSFQFPVSLLTVPADCNSTFIRDNMLSQVSYEWQLNRYRQLAMASLDYHS